MTILILFNTIMKIVKENSGIQSKKASLADELYVIGKELVEWDKLLSQYNLQLSCFLKMLNFSHLSAVDMCRFIAFKQLNLILRLWKFGAY